jgi:hypothetical protein
MADQPHADFGFRALHQADQTGRQLVRVQRVLHQREQLAREQRMRRMRLDHHAAASRQCRCRVAAQHRKGKREIADSKHRNRAERHALAHYRPVPGRRSARDGRIVQARERHAARGQDGEAAQLESSAILPGARAADRPAALPARYWRS